MVVADNAGGEFGEIWYRSFGKPRPGYPTGSIPTSYRFTGQFSEESSIGLYYYQARWYDNPSCYLELKQ
jgi:hypothetical protein